MQTNRVVTILFCIVIFSGTLLFGKDYQTIHKKGVFYFNNLDNVVSCIRIDSVKSDVDSIFYPFTIMQQISEVCYSPYKASWIGEKVVIQPNGDNLFFNKYGDTIRLKTNAKHGESWIAAQIDDSIKVEATVLQHDTLEFLGLTDSVKTIGFKVTDKDGSLLDYDLNQRQVQISKKYGFVQTLNFYMFPDLEDNYLSNQIFEERTLCGLSNPKVGFQNLTWMEVNDFQVGDEIHVRKTEDNFFQGNGYIQIEKRIYNYIKRTDYSDSIKYEYILTASKDRNYPNTPEHNTFEFFVDTLKLLVAPDNFFDKLPGEPVISELSNYNSYFMQQSDPNTKTENTDFFSGDGDSCFSRIIWDGCPGVGSYLKGLGGPYYNCFMSGTMKDLVYYKKGETTWGDPLEINATHHIPDIPMVKVYPNPADNQINVAIDSGNQPMVFELVNLLGQVVLSRSLTGVDSKINIDEITSGTYLYKIVQNSQDVQTGKLVIH